MHIWLTFASTAYAWAGGGASASAASIGACSAGVPSSFLSPASLQVDSKAADGDAT